MIAEACFVLVRCFGLEIHPEICGFLPKTTFRTFDDLWLLYCVFNLRFNFNLAHTVQPLPKEEKIAMTQ